jgi:uncharacterized protein involved in outer membrane biogenesis
MQGPHRLRWWAGLTLALLGIGLLLGELSGWPFLRQPLQDAMSRASGVAVRLDGRFRTRLLWQPHLSIEHLNIAAAGGLQVPHLLDAREVELAWRWHDVWRWHRGAVLRVRQLQAGFMDARLARSRDGRASWQLGEPRVGAQPDEPRSARGSLPLFDLLRIGHGLIVVDDQRLDTQLRIELQGVEEDNRPRGAHPPVLPGQQARVVGHYQALPLRLQLRSGAALPLLADSAAEGRTDPASLVPLRVEGEAGAARVFFDGRAAALLGNRPLQGVLRLRGPSLAPVGRPFGLTLPRTPPFELSGQLGHAAGVWHLQAQRAAIGRSLLQGDFRYDTRVSPARLSGRLSGPRLALADLGPAVGAPAPGEPGRGTPARVLPQRRFDLPSLRAMDADVQVAMDELDLGSAAVAPLRQLRTRLLLQAGVLDLQALRAVVAGGQFRGSTRLDSNADPARWTIDLRFDAVDVAGWLRGLRARPGGDRQAPQAYLTGLLAGAIQASGAGRSSAEILAALDGRAHLALHEGTLSHLATEALGLDIAQALGVLVRGDRPLPLRCAYLDLVMRQGVVRPRRAVLDNADSTLRLAGQIDLRDESLALQASVRPKDVSPLSLRSPLTLAGTLGAPVVSIDSRQLAGKLLGAAALGALVAPVAALLPLIDRGRGDAPDPCAGLAAARPSAPAASAAADASAVAR